MPTNYPYNLRKRRDPLLKYWARLPNDLLPSIFVLAVARQPRRSQRLRDPS